MRLVTRGVLSGMFNAGGRHDDCDKVRAKSESTIERGEGSALEVIEEGCG